MHTLSCKKQIKTSDGGLGTKAQEDKEVVFVCVCMRCVCWSVFWETDAVQLLTCHLSSRKEFYLCMLVCIQRKDETEEKERNSEWGADVSQHRGWNTRFNGRLLYERSWRGRTEKKRGRTSAIFRYCSEVWVFLHNIFSVNRPGKRPAH